MYIGLIMAIVGGIMMLIEAFRESILWGICSLFIPFVLLIFVILNFDQCKNGFIIWLIGTILWGGIFISIGGDAFAPESQSSY
ncbi:MAG: hypothetical protein P8M22_11215 [Phycisphaerales bacterium]|nr:hypothetical protein [Phycisphaerales bacterium]